MGLLQEFKEFAIKGNAVDMAIGVIIGAAFGKIVASLVDNILMPPLGMLIGGVDFKNLEVVLKAAEGTQPAVSIRYGLFLNNVFDFLIVAFTLFMVIKVMSHAMAKRSKA